MAMQPERYERRTVASVAVMLTSPEYAYTTELTLTENISERGARVWTKKPWWPDDSVVIKSLEGDLQSEARVVYRQHMRGNVYAIGLQLLAPKGNWRGNAV